MWRLLNGLQHHCQGASNGGQVARTLSQQPLVFLVSWDSDIFLSHRVDRVNQGFGQIVHCVRGNFSPAAETRYSRLRGSRSIKIMTTDGRPVSTSYMVSHFSAKKYQKKIVSRRRFLFKNIPFKIKKTVKK